MTAYTQTLTLQATDIDGVCASQAPAGAGSLTIAGALASGGVATLSAASILTVTTTSDETGETITITGTDANGIVISEALAGPNASTVNTTLYFKTVTAVTVTAAATGVTVGHTSTNGCVSASIPCKWYDRDWKASVGVYLASGGTGSGLTVQVTQDDPYTDTAARWVDHDVLAGLSANGLDNLYFPVQAIRLKATAMSSTVQLKMLEAH